MHLRENSGTKNNFPSSRFARWPGQRQALGCFLFKLARYDGNKKCIKRIVQAALSLVISPLFQFFPRKVLRFAQGKNKETLELGKRSDNIKMSVNRKTFAFSFGKIIITWKSKLQNLLKRNHFQHLMLYMEQLFAVIAMQDPIFSICKFCIRPNFSSSVT